MLNLETAKQIVLIKNNDGTYNMIANFDVYETDGKTLNCEMECNYHKAKIKKFDVEVLLSYEENNYMEVSMKV